MTGELGTTNLLLGIMAAVSVLEALVDHRHGRRRLHGLQEGDGPRRRALETRQVAPAMIRVNAILDDVKDVTRESEGRDRAGRPRHSLDDRSDRRHGGAGALERAGEDQSRGRLRARCCAWRLNRCMRAPRTSTRELGGDRWQTDTIVSRMKAAAAAAS